MKIHSESFLDRRSLPTRCAFGRYRFYPRDLELPDRFELSDNRNPHLAWEGAPEGTRSFAIVCHDPEAPSDPTVVNAKDRVVPRDLERTRFHHWVLVDLPPEARGVAEGEHSDGVVAGGKSAEDCPRGRAGLNDYTGWFSDDAQMQGRYFGYDGPAPPWNDELIHWYVFTVYALDVDQLPLEGAFTARDALEAMEGHVLAEASIEGFYYIYPEARFR